MTNPRIAKLEDQIQEIIAAMLQRRIKDHRLGFVTVTDVRLTGDSREATVFYTVLGDDANLAASAAALESAKGLLRSTVGKQLGLRFAPTLAFVPDATAEVAQDMAELLAKARAADEQRAKLAEGKSFAGDADPYRHDADDADE